MRPIDPEFAPLDGALPSGWSTPRAKRPPAPPVVSLPRRPRSRWVVVGVVALVSMLASFALVVLADRLWQPDRPAPPDAEGVAVGRALAPALSEALAKGFDAAATLIDSGQPVRMADDTLKSTFDTERKAAFGKLGGPYLDKLVPSGKEPETEAGRKAFAEAHRAIARGLRDGR